MTGRLYYGDNLDVLRNKIGTETVDLCYNDPPFNSKRNYFQIYNNIGQEDSAQAEAFVDTWSWEDHARDGFDEIRDNPQGRFHPKLVHLIVGLHSVVGEGSLLAYLVSMALRLTEAHRVLKKTGSFYLHCDPTASHYLKIILDAIFVSQGGQFQNEIIWKRTGSHSPRRSFGPVHDVILYYTKAVQGYTFNVVRRPYMKGHVESRYSKQPDGRYKFTSGGNVLTGPGWTAGGSGKSWRRFSEDMLRTKNRHWAIPSIYEDFMPPEYQQLGVLEKLDALYQAGLIEDDDKSEWPIMVRYLSERDGMPVTDIWAYQPYTDGTVYGSSAGIDDDVQPLGPTDPERLGYPTQKPEGLLSRIIRTSTNEGDLVLDAYCGCGTTIVAAERLSRNWVGIDITYQSISLMLRRIESVFGTEAAEAITTDGVPRDMDSARALATKKDDRVRKEFEKWAVLTYSRNRAVINDKKGADKGIDGIAFFKVGKRENAKIIFQVKSGNVGRGDISALLGVVDRERAAMGIFITLQNPTKPMREEAKSAGTYQHEDMAQRYDRILIVTVEEIIVGKQRLELPMSIEVLNNAKKALEQGQGTLI
jgi:DNA modification methylase